MTVDLVEIVACRIMGNNKTISVHELVARLKTMCHATTDTNLSISNNAYLRATLTLMIPSTEISEDPYDKYVRLMKLYEQTSLIPPPSVACDLSTLFSGTNAKERNSRFVGFLNNCEWKEDVS